jgi:hypothetical protein
MEAVLGSLRHYAHGGSSEGEPGFSGESSELIMLVAGSSPAPGICRSIT